MIRSVLRGARGRRGLLLACVATLAWPAAASARAGDSFVFGPVSDHGYQAEGVLTPTSSTSYSIGFVFSRKVGAQQQIYVYNDSSAIHAQISSSLSSARVHATFGSAGKVSLSFHPQGGLTHQAFSGTGNLLGCKVSKQLTRMGRATGSFSFNTGSVFGTIHGRDVAARLARYPKVSTCHTQRTMSLELNGPSGPSSAAENFLQAVHTGSLTFVDATYQVQATSTDPFSLEALMAQVSGAAFSAAPSLSSASVSTHGSFLNGTARFTKTSSCNAHGAFGSITGSIKAHFLIGGTQVYPSVTSTPITATPPGGSPNPFGVLSTGLVGCF
jgi:hypothetical protein